MQGRGEGYCALRGAEGERGGRGTPGVGDGRELGSGRGRGLGGGRGELGIGVREGHGDEVTDKFMLIRLFGGREF